MSSTESTPRVLRMYRMAERLPLGRRLFTNVFQRVAPYFQTIPVLVETIEPGRAVVTMRDRRAVRNHLGTVHAIALCNLAELAMGVTAEATIPVTHRWIPRGMEVEYLAKARGTMTATSTLSLPANLDDKVELPVTIAVSDKTGAEVFRAVIRIWVTRKKA